MPKVSVIIPTHNRAHLVCDAIDSILSQTFEDYEIIVVDDGSVDNTKEVLEKYGSGICYIYQENKGRAEARNTGIRQAKAEYIAFLDDDDMWLPNKLKKQVVFLDTHPDIGLVHTFIKMVDERGHLLNKETQVHFKSYKRAMRIGYTYVGMSNLCAMFISTVMVRKDCLDEVGLFDYNTESLEDWDFYLRFALKYRISTIWEFLVKYRLHKAHTANSEFIRGRINASMKHLAMLDSYDVLSSCNQIRYNFYMHLANAHYIARHLKECRKYALKAIKLNPWILFRSRLGIHLLVTFLPAHLIQKMR